MKWKRDIIIIAVALVGIPAYMVHEPSDASPPWEQPGGPLHVRDITPEDIALGIMRGDPEMDWDDSNVTNGQDIQFYVDHFSVRPRH